MGTYGMGVSRLIAAIIEQHHDEKGCVWTKTTAPFAVNLMISNIKDDAQTALAESLYTSLQNTGVEVIMDDRKERFGFKVRDAELVGYPLTVIIGKELENGIVQFYDRAEETKSDVPAEEAFARIMEWLG